ncbi:MAG TPA: hypothetical protein VGF17_02285 [Phytomonospora sp.]
MLYVEVNVPEGRLSLAERRRLAAMLTADDILAGELDPGAAGRCRPLTHVLVREAEVWLAGGRFAHASGSARYLVTVHAGPWAEALAGRLVTEITRRIEDFEGDPDATRFGGRCLVHVVGVAPGGVAAYGEVLTGAGLAADERAPGASPGRPRLSEVPG